jgi:MFS family permease
MSARYAQLARVPGLPSLYLTAVLAGLPAGVLPLGLVVLVESETGSLASAGLVLAAQLGGIAVGAPLWTRTSDRAGQSRVLGPLAVLNAGALVCLVALVAAGAHVAVLVAAAAAAGLAYPPIGSSLRVVSASLLDGADQREAAYSLQAVSVELIYIGGPALTGLVLAVGSPEAAVLCAAAGSLGGGLAFAAHPASRAWRPAPARRTMLGALRSPGMRTLVLGTLALGAVLGGLDVATPAFAEEHGEAAQAGIALSCLAIGSALGGIVYGARRWPGRPADRYGVLFAGLALFLSLLTAASSVLALAALMFLAGMAVAPLSATGFALIDDTAPPGTATEATGWIVTAYTLGAGLGALVAGTVAEALDVEAAFAAACASAAAGAIVAALGRRSLTGAQ